MNWYIEGVKTEKAILRSSCRDSMIGQFRQGGLSSCLFPTERLRSTLFLK